MLRQFLAPRMGTRSGAQIWELVNHPIPEGVGRRFWKISE